MSTTTCCFVRSVDTASAVVQTAVAAAARCQNREISRLRLWRATSNAAVAMAAGSDTWPLGTAQSVVSSCWMTASSDPSGATVRAAMRVGTRA